MARIPAATGADARRARPPQARGLLAGQASGGAHLGYAVPKRQRNYWSVWLGYELLRHSFSLFLDPRLRPRLPYLIRQVPLVAIGIPWAMFLGRANRHRSGFYQLDEAGRPLYFVSKGIPPSIRGRQGVGQRAFLRQVSDLH